MAPPARRPAVAEAPRVLEATSFGAVPDGRTICTQGLQRAIDACAAAGGGTVVVPPGRYVTGALFLRSHVHLHLASGATLAGSGRFEDFPAIKGREEGVERMVHSSLITGIDVEDVAVTGRGRLDGQGQPWWKADAVVRKLQLDRKLPRGAAYPSDAPLKWPRPRTINLVRCRDVLLEGLTLVDGPGVNVHLLYCQDVAVTRLTTFQNTEVRSSEAIIVDSTRGVTISDCRLSAGADGIGIKSGYNEEGRRIGIPSENVLITNCHLYKVSSAVVIGSETAGGVRNVVVSHCVFRDCFSAVRIRSPRGRGGVVEKVRVSDVLVDGTEDVAIKLSNFFDSLRSEGRLWQSGPARQNMELARSRKAAVDEGTPLFRDFTFSGLTFARVKEVALVEGLPERPMERVVFEDLAAPNARSGITCNLVADLRIANFQTVALDTPAVDAREVERVEVHRLRCPRPPADTPLVFLEEVGRAFVHGCYAGKSTRPHWLEQERCREVTLEANGVG